MGRDSHILTINSGSSSIKFSLYALGETESLILKGELAGIGGEHGYFQTEDQAGHQLTARKIDLPDHDATWNILFEWLQSHEVGKDLHAVGHRLVHGGTAHVRPQLVSPALIADLKLLMPLAPDHLPHEIKGLEAVHRHYPRLPQVVCFDTAFHRRMAEVAQRYALPEPLFRAGLQRYGFHGLSYEYLTQELEREAGPQEASGKLIIAHLGNGASLAAIEAGRSLDTTMGLTPAGGLVMSTRSGDLDPGVIIYLLQEKGMAPAAVNRLINHQAGLLGISGISSDMQDLLARADTEVGAALAVELFCYQARKFAGALTAVLGGLDTFIFTGGIGENSATIRARICANLEFLGIHLDPELNQENAPIISKQDSRVTVRVMKTDEELIIARHTQICSLDNGG
jgi:acetate kinase